MVRRITLTTLILLGYVHAHERLWTFTYDTDYLPKGLLELEQWITYEEGRTNNFYSWSMRTEIEYVPSPRLSLALYLNYSRVLLVDGNSLSDRFTFSGISIAGIYRFTNPRTSLLGTGLYLEYSYDVGKTALEEKLLLSRWFSDRLNVALNIVLEQEWKKDLIYGNYLREAVLYFSGGFAYMLGGYALGLEFYQHNEWSGTILPSSWTQAEHHAFFVGPAMHYSIDRFWITLSIMPQLTNVLDEHSRLMLRTIFSFVF